MNRCKNGNPSLPKNLEHYNLYELFESNEDDSINDIRRKYRELALKFHPDKNKNEAEAKKFLVLKDAFDFLLDDKSRNEYNKILRDKKRKNKIFFELDQKKLAFMRKLQKKEEEDLNNINNSNNDSNLFFSYSYSATSSKSSDNSSFFPNGFGSGTNVKFDNFSYKTLLNMKKKNEDILKNRNDFLRHKREEMRKNSSEVLNENQKTENCKNQNLHNYGEYEENQSNNEKKYRTIFILFGRKNNELDGLDTPSYFSSFFKSNQDEIAFICNLLIDITGIIDIKKYKLNNIVGDVKCTELNREIFKISRYIEGFDGDKSDFEEELYNKKNVIYEIILSDRESAIKCMLNLKKKKKRSIKKKKENGEEYVLDESKFKANFTSEDLMKNLYYMFYDEVIEYFKTLNIEKIDEEDLNLDDQIIRTNVFSDKKLVNNNIVKSELNLEFQSKKRSSIHKNGFKNAEMDILKRFRDAAILRKQVVKEKD